MEFESIVCARAFCLRVWQVHLFSVNCTFRFLVCFTFFSYSHNTFISLLGVTADDHMMKVETVLCSACSVYVPALHSSVQQHLKSPEHAKGKQVRLNHTSSDQSLRARNGYRIRIGGGGE